MKERVAKGAGPMTCRGFSLVELLIGLTVTMALVGAFIGLFINQNKAYSSESLRQEMMLSGRIALDEVQREAMNAGTGLPGLFASVQVFDSGPDQPDTVTFIYVPQGSLHLQFDTSPKPNKSANSMKFSSASEVSQLVVGDHLIIYDEVDFNIVEITGINLSSRTAIFVPPVGVNTPAGLAKAYDPSTAVITRVSLMSLTVDRSDPAHPALVKFRGGNNLGQVAWDIENFQVTIIFEDGDTAAATVDDDSDLTNDSMDLRGVLATVFARSSRTDPRNNSGDRFWHQEFTSTIAPRNLIY